MEALLMVDLQKDFLPGGSLEVKEGDSVIPKVNKLAESFDLVIATQDWHPKDHGSFASNHENRKPGDQIMLKGIRQILWPDHCVQHSEGAGFANDLDIEQAEKIFKKGDDPNYDSYSGFYDNGHKKATGLHTCLQEKEVDKVIIAGLAADFCVKYTALDALDLGYETEVVEDATRAVEGKEGYKKRWRRWRRRGRGW